MKNPIACISFQLVLGFIFFSLVSCDCPFPKKDFPNGRVMYQEQSDVNETIAEELYILGFRCYKGYTRIGAKFIQCVDDEWTNVVPTCAKMQCSEPPDIPKAEYLLHAGVDNFPALGALVTYSCKVGYELNNTNASTLHCVLNLNANRGIWKGEMPSCKAKESCPNPGVSKHGFKRGHCCFAGDVLSYSCYDNYELIGNKAIKCLPTGSWSSGRPFCRPLGEYCKPPPPIPHGVVTGDKEGDYFRPFDEAEILCKPGYTYRGLSRFVECQEKGKWEAEFGECTETFCDRPNPLLNGTITELETTNLTSFPYKFDLTYICDEHFRLIGGDSWRICDTNGWSGKTPYCEVIKCPDPGSPENGMRLGDNFEVGEKVRFKCFTGYMLIGSLERYCMPNGQWTGELSRCDAPFNYCPNPGIPIKGSKNSTYYEMGDVVGFQCHPGYILIGSEARVCLLNKTWSGTEAKCLGPYDFDNGAKVRDILKAKVAEKAEEQAMALQRYREAVLASRLEGAVPAGKILDINFPGRLILYFAFDVSGSVGQHNFEKSVQFAKAIVKRVGISSSGARAGALTFSSKAENMFLPVLYTNTEDVLRAFDRIQYTGGGTAATSALSLIRTQNIPLVEEILGKKNVKSVVFILTDGKANMGGSPQEEAEILKKAGVEIYCIGITGSIEKESLYKIASTSTDSNGEHPNVYILQNYATLSWLVQEITNGTVDYSQCGLGMENIGVDQNRGKIVGGKYSLEAWPWMAALYMTFGTNIPPDMELQCGASIINKDFILTAAHCMFDARRQREKEKTIIVKLGLTDVRNETYIQQLAVKKIFVHDKYRPGNFYDYDIALLQLSRPVEYNPFVRPICLPPKDLPNDSPFYKSNEISWATGWGHESVAYPGEHEYKSTKSLKEVAMPIQSRERCIQSLADNALDVKFFSDRMFCAGDGKRGNDTCRGDSGGPLMQSKLNSEGFLYWTQVGIVSWGIGCGVENTYGYYSHVQRLRSWIDETMERALHDNV